MTDREKAIVMAYTGAVMLTGDKLGEYYKYLQELLNRPVYPHEIFFLEKEIKEKSEADFIKLCNETEEKKTVRFTYNGMGDWIEISKNKHWDSVSIDDHCGEGYLFEHIDDEFFDTLIKQLERCGYKRIGDKQ